MDGTNYMNWMFKMKILMEGYNLWSTKSGDEVKPEKGVGPTTNQFKIGRRERLW